MPNSLNTLISDVICGFKDSFLGVTALYNIYIESKNRTDAGQEKKPEPMTALARRRAERLKKTQEPTSQKENNVIQRIALCCAWNGGVFLMSIVFFNYLLMPTLKSVIHFIFGGSETHNSVWLWIVAVVGWTFNALWILPLFVLSKFVNCFWFQDIADAAYRKSRGRPLMLPGLGKIIADVLFSVILQSFFLVQGMLASLLPIPVIGHVVYMLHMCLLYSLYAFEYKWFNMGWEVHRRLHYIERHWSYFVGFGLPLSVLTSMPDSYIISGCVFSLLFPLFIISGNQADIQPPPFEIPLRLFSIVISLTDKIFQQSIKKTTQQKTGPETTEFDPYEPHKSAKSVRLKES